MQPKYYASLLCQLLSNSPHETRYLPERDHRMVAQN